MRLKIGKDKTGIASNQENKKNQNGPKSGFRIYGVNRAACKIAEHCKFKKHLYNLKPSSVSICSGCNEEDETALNIISQFKVFTKQNKIFIHNISP